VFERSVYAGSVRAVTIAIALALAACAAGGSGSVTNADDAGGRVVMEADASIGSDDGDAGDGALEDAAIDAGADADSGWMDALDANRDRLLGTYLAFLKSNPAQTQSNGLSGATVSDVCDLWTQLDASSQAVFLTLTHRMQGSKLGADGSSMLVHVAKVYRIVGGQDAKKSPPGSCGGGEYNRMIMSMDAVLQSTLVAANTHHGAVQPNGKPDISDIPTHPNNFWRDSHDLGGPHGPFNLSDEADPGAPRGQVQFFRDPTSTVAKAPLGRMDLATLVDPYALEMDQDYDCIHNSNPRCDYITYGPGCFPQLQSKGTDRYAANYGAFEPAWRPSGCP
jgi:hypothetical protein